MNKNILIGVLAVIAFVFVVLYFGRGGIFGASSGPEHYNAEYFYNGLTSSGTNTLSGATTITGTANVSQTTSSTLKIGYNASGLEYGCLVLGDSEGATSTPVYITATGGTITATTTKPAICR